MPLYRTVIRPELLDLAQREAFATDVMNVHCDVTGAPPSLVHVLYMPDDGQLPDGTDAHVVGTIRGGRTGDQKGEIRERLATLLAERSGLDPSAIRIDSIDIDASRTMEGGVLLPEPGSAEEEEWKTAGAS